MSVRAVALACAFYLGLTLVFTWPLAAHLSTHLPHDLGDPLLSAWILWWHAHALPFSAAWWDGLGFFPAHGSLAFSDHRVGLALLTTPLQWAGGNPTLAYNGALIASFALSAVAAHALAFSLTRKHAAAVLAGVIYGFNPFRMPHIVHIEILSSYWMPFALLGLHQWLRSHRRRWLVVFAGASLLQALTCGYYLFYLSVLVGCWAIWFLPIRGGPAAWRQTILPIAIAWVASVLPLAPILWRYRSIHETFGLRRALWEVELFSADVAGLLSGSPVLDRWPWFARLWKAEGEIFPGMVATAVVAVAAAYAWRTRGSSRGARMRWLFLVVAAIGAGTAVSFWLGGPWSLSLGPILISVNRLHKALSIAIFAMGAYAISAPSFLSAWRRQSVMAFYTCATVGLWILAFGPAPRLLGQRILYKAPYAWLMELPGFDGGLRAPARFAMVAALCLAVAAAVGLTRLLANRPPRQMSVVCLVLAMLAFAESRPLSFALVQTPPPLDVPVVAANEAVLELPLGGSEDDGRAIYDSMAHRRPVVNGFSGYDPGYYVLLRIAVARRDPEALVSLTGHAPLLVVLRGTAAAQADWETYVKMIPDARLVERSASATFYFLPGHTAAPQPEAPLVPIRGVVANGAESAAGLMIDHRLDTGWIYPNPQTGTEEVRVDLEGTQDVCGVRLTQGTWLGVPARLDIDVPENGSWRQIWSGTTVGRAVAAALDGPRRIAIPIGFPRQPRPAALRLRQTYQDTQNPWSIAELDVAGCR